MTVCTRCDVCETVVPAEDAREGGWILVDPLAVGIPSRHVCSWACLGMLAVEAPDFAEEPTDAA